MTYSLVQMLINNEWRPARDIAVQKVHNPADGSVIGSVAKVTIKGSETWRSTPSQDRGKLMRAAASLLRERTGTVAWLMTLEQGKPPAEFNAEIMMACETIEWFAGESRRVYGRVMSQRCMAQQQTVLRDPEGPVAAFAPWNFPIKQVVCKLCAALAAGCSMIIKAPEETPAYPAEISNDLIPHPIIRKITCTGSTPVGKQLAALAGAHMKRATMELGGHAPVIVAADANIANAIKVIAGDKFRNAGQVCISPTRFLVEEAVREEFVAGFLKHIQGLKVDSGLEVGVGMGPLANPRSLSAMQEITRNAVERGAKVAIGGERIGSSGNYFAPTLLLDRPLGSTVFNNEPFGPWPPFTRSKAWTRLSARPTSCHSTCRPIHLPAASRPRTNSAPMCRPTSCGSTRLPLLGPSYIFEVLRILATAAKAGRKHWMPTCSSRRWR
jgi:succinate-semialdehyde dehydrogenase/glutarate-semialdehyde dehydrogenase